VRRRSVGVVPKYLVELYLPADGERAALARAARRVDAGYVRTIFLADEETCFHEYESPSRDVLAAALANARLTYDRLIEAEVL
jgi:hypothetical protein